MAYRCAGIPFKTQGAGVVYREPKDSLLLICRVMSFLSLVVAVLVVLSVGYGLASGLQLTNGSLAFLLGLVMVLLAMGITARITPRQRVSVVCEGEVNQVYLGKRRVAALDSLSPEICCSKSSIVVFPVYMRGTKVGKDILRREYATWIRLSCSRRSRSRFCLLQINENIQDARGSFEQWATSLNLNQSEFDISTNAPKTIHISCPEWSLFGRARRGKL